MKIFKCLRNILAQSNTIDLQKSNIPTEFSIEEKISRTIFSPMNVKKDDTLRNNSFTTPSDLDEVSVSRLDFTTPDLIKKIGKFISNPDSGRSYFGVAIIDVGQIYESDSQIVYSPTTMEINNKTMENIFHSDIKIGYVKQAGNPLPMKYAYKVEQMVQKARFYKDSDVNSDSWKGDDLV